MGPAILVTAAFIGPGTVTVCSLAGYQFGYALLWALLFSILATIVLQEMCSRLGVVTQKGLGTLIREELPSPALRVVGIVLVGSAILIGNAAYEAGNISGASLGISTILPVKLGSNINFWSIAIGLVAFLLLYSGKYKVIERALIGLTILMSIVFVSTAIIIQPDPGALFHGLFVPSFPAGSTMIVVGLIGTTVVPYNLFLHTSAVSERWKDKSGVKEARWDTIISVSLGGLISLAIVITSAYAGLALNGTAISGADDLALQLEPVLGSWSKYFMASGLFAAGISSSITAPLAAAYATVGIFGKEIGTSNPLFRGIALSILVIGIVFSSLGFKPIDVIAFAQFANGLLLPLIAIFLLWLMNNTRILGSFQNSLLQNIMGAVVILITIILGLKSILSVLNIL